MKTTQEHLSIADIQEDIILLRDGGGALVLQTSAVNFGLLSDREQMAIIAAFAQMLNSLSFSIQIVIHSERLNISSYLNLLDKAQKIQNNPLLKQMITQYRQFIQNTIKENEVLDKKFYIVVPLYKLELGLITSKQNLQAKIKTVLLPRRNQILRQLNRVGLKATQLTQEKLLEVFFDIYNGLTFENLPMGSVNLNYPKPTTPVKQAAIPAPLPSNTEPAQPSPAAANFAQTPSRTPPFVVEELNDNV